jgi:23S rRNA-/tRNA-specific pseudouridylate synthase
LQKRNGNNDCTYPIHRIDQGTKGLCLFAKNKSSAQMLSQAFQERSVGKKYLARSKIIRHPPKEGEMSGLWRWPLTNRAESRKQPKGYWAKRIPCVTEWAIIKQHDEQIIDLELVPVTGRRHQLRRHLAIWGWPLLGDKRYGPENESELSGEGHLIAHFLSFFDPETSEIIEIYSKFELPQYSAIS